MANFVNASKTTFITNTTEKIMTTKTVKKKAAPKKTSPQKKSTKKTKADEPSLKIIQTAKCQTISGKSTLTYNIATNNEDNLFMRINGNTGGGFFSNEWVSLNHITSVLREVSGEHITSLHLFPLFKGKSVNTPGYLLAVLLKEGLLSQVEDKKRKYQFTGVDAFMAKLEKKLK